VIGQQSQLLVSHMMLVVQLMVYQQQQFTVSLSLKGLSQTKQKELQALAFGRWVIFVRDSNDNIWMIGTYEGCLMNGGNGSTGAAKGDLNGYTLTLVSEDKYRAPRLESYTTVPFDNFAGITVEDN